MQYLNLNKRVSYLLPSLMVLFPMDSKDNNFSHPAPGLKVIPYFTQKWSFLSLTEGLCFSINNYASEGLGGATNGTGHKCITV